MVVICLGRGHIQHHEKVWLLWENIIVTKKIGIQYFLHAGHMRFFKFFSSYHNFSLISLWVFVVMHDKYLSL